MGRDQLISILNFKLFKANEIINEIRERCQYLIIDLKGNKDMTSKDKGIDDVDINDDIKEKKNYELLNNNSNNDNDYIKIENKYNQNNIVDKKQEENERERINIQNQYDNMKQELICQIVEIQRIQQKDDNNWKYIDLER